MRVTYRPLGRKEREAFKRAGLEWVLGGECADCGTKKDLQFDHIDLDGPRCCSSAIWRQPWERILKDLSNLQLLCSPCHARKTSAENATLV